MDLNIENYNKKTKCKLEENQPSNGIENLPREIALDILSRLPITSLLQSRFVCRAWQKLSLDQNLVNLHLSQAATRNPLLIFHCDNPIQNQLYFAELSHLNDKEKLRKIHTPFCASMPEFNVVGSCHGLLCLSDSLHNDAIFIYNPFTRDYKELPKSRTYHEQEVMIGFGFHPVINEYKVVKIINYWNEYIGRFNSQSEVQLFSPIRNKWRSMGKVPYQLERQSPEAVFLNGRLHWMTRHRTRPGRYNNARIIAFDLADEQFHEVLKPDFGGLNRPNYHLAVLGGCLSAVVYYSKEEELEIWIMKEYNVKESWITAYRIGAFFPRLLHQDFLRPYQIWKNNFRRRKVRVLCVLKNGEILLEYRYGTLASYDPESGKFRERMFPGMPSMFQAVVHLGSLNWIDIPTREIALNILSKLPITSIIQSRFVCRAWHTLSLDQNLAYLHLSEAVKRHPFLIFHCDYPIRNQLYFVEFADDDQGKVRRISTPFSASMSEFNVVGSCNGILCLSDSLYKDAVYIYNPFTRDYKELPKTRQYEDQEVVCGFGFHPETNEYKVVKIVYHWNFVNTGSWHTRRIRIPGHSKSEILVFSFRSNTWRSIGKVPYQIERRSSQALFTNGRLHWLTRSMYRNVRGLLIICFDLADEQFHEVPRPDFSVQNGLNYHLTLLRGRLSAVVCSRGELEIWVMKEYNVKESWIKEFRMGAYLPELLQQKLQQPFRIWGNTFNRLAVRVLCILKNGEILVEYKVGRLALYDPGSGGYRDLTFKGMPNMFQTVAHIGSLNWIQSSN